MSNYVAAFEHLAQDHVTLTKSYLQLAQENEALKAQLSQQTAMPASTSPSSASSSAFSEALWSSKPAPASLTGSAVKPQWAKRGCLCAKCTTGMGECKKFDEWT